MGFQKLTFFLTAPSWLPMDPFTTLSCRNAQCSVIVCTSNPQFEIVPPRWRPRPDFLNICTTTFGKIWRFNGHGTRDDFWKISKYFFVHVFEIQILRKFEIKNRSGGFCAILGSTTRKQLQYTCRNTLFKPLLNSGDLNNFRWKFSIHIFTITIISL